MDDREYELWKKLQLNGYSAKRATLGILALREFIIKPEEKLEAIRLLHSEFNDYHKKLDALDLKELDNRFPVSTVRNLREELLPQTIQTISSIKELLARHIENKEDEEIKRELKSKFSECVPLLKLLRANEVEFRAHNSRRYDEFRKERSLRREEFR